MAADKFEKTAFSVFVIAIATIVGFFILFGWGFVQVVQWLTSK